MAEKRNFSQEISDFMYTPHGSSTNHCIQCGSCSGTCPAVEYMDETPRRLIGMINANLREDVIDANTAWVCSSCYHCTVRCPAKIDIAGVMYAVKCYSIQNKTYAKDWVGPAFSKAFIKTVSKNAKTYEPLLAPTYIFGFEAKEFFLEIQNASKLMFKGRLSILPPTNKRRAEFQNVVKRAISTGEKE